VGRKAVRAVIGLPNGGVTTCIARPANILVIEGGETVSGDAETAIAAGASACASQVLPAVLSAVV
jgi:hypothetical protein